MPSEPFFMCVCDQRIINENHKLFVFLQTMNSAQSSSERCSDAKPFSYTEGLTCLQKISLVVWEVFRSKPWNDMKASQSYYSLSHCQRLCPVIPWMFFASVPVLVMTSLKTCSIQWYHSPEIFYLLSYWVKVQTSFSTLCFTYNWCHTSQGLSEIYHNKSSLIRKVQLKILRARFR